MKVSFIHDQKGFSAVGLFFLILSLVILMNFTGVFSVIKSEVEDKSIYKATGSKEAKSKGILMTDVTFEKPTEAPQPTSQPNITPIPTTVFLPAPTIDPNMCVPYSKVAGCKCVAPYHYLVYCNGRIPPANADCTGDLTSCSEQIIGKSNCVEYCAAKPVIYLYPITPIFVDVKITTPGRFVDHIPPLEFYRVSETETIAGWTKVFAQPSGVLTYDNKYFRELFYDTSLSYVRAPDHGKFIETKNLRAELYKFVTDLGLISDEADEFVEYWVPKLESLNKNYIFTSVVENNEKQRVDKVVISPKPDVFIEFMAYFNAVDEKFEAKPIELPTAPERKGFTAVEWGGVIEPSSYE